MIRGLNRDWIGFLYCTPHAFHQGHDAATIIEAAGDKVRYVHLADAWDHTDVQRPALHLQPARQSPPGCTSTWRWAWARSTTTRSSPHSRPSASTG